MADNSEKIIEKAKKFSLTSEEKFAIKKQLISYTDMNPVRNASYSFFGFMNLRSVYLVPLTLILIFGGTLGFLSNKSDESLPYPVILGGEPDINAITAMAPVEENFAAFSATSEVQMTSMSLEAPKNEVLMMQPEEKSTMKISASNISTTSKSEEEKESDNNEKRGKRSATSRIVSAIENFFGISKKESGTTTATSTKSKKERKLEEKRLKELRKLEEDREEERD